MAIDIYYGVDGTGPEDDKSYKKEFQNSFVRQFEANFLWNKSEYNRGPSLEGIETKHLGRGAYYFAKIHYEHITRNKKTDPRIFLAGYSRGGAAVIHACHLLKSRGIPVYCLILFDAVQRVIPLDFAVIPSDVDVIPDNVQHVFHAKRKWSTFSRLEFGNRGESVENATRTSYVEEEFFCTHGGIGGTPHVAGTAVTTTNFLTGKKMIHENSKFLYSTNISLTQEQEGSKQAGAWMRLHLFVTKSKVFKPDNNGGPIAH